MTGKNKYTNVRTFITNTYILIKKNIYIIGFIFNLTRLIKMTVKLNVKHV